MFFFVVDWFRYNGDAGFRSKNAFYQAQFWSEWKTLSFGGRTYRAANRQVQLYNVEEGCYDVVFGGTGEELSGWSVGGQNSGVDEGSGIASKQCIGENAVMFDTFVTHRGNTGFVDNALSPCAVIERKSRGEYTVGGMTYAKPIQAVFAAREVPFLQVDDVLYACTPDYKTCRTVLKMAGDPVCSTKEGIVYNASGSLVMVELE
jgi:hypothetical protein